MRTVPLLLPLALVACKTPIEAPTELNELAHFLWAEWDNEDPEVMAAGVLALESWAAGEPADASSWPDRFYGIDAIPAATAEAEGLTSHGRSADDAPGVGLLFVSVHAPPAHATLFGLADQTDPIEPASPDIYDRTITSGDPDAFAAGDEEVLESTNSINRKNLLFDLNYELDKVWRWVTLDEASGRRAIASRSWAREVGEENDGKQIFQAYSMELWVPDEGGGSLRWLVTWQEAELGLDQDAVDSLVGGSMNDTFESQDELLSQ